MIMQGGLGRAEGRKQNFLVYCKRSEMGNSGTELDALGLS